MTLSTTAIRAAFAQETGEVFLVLLTISHASLPVPIRVTSDGVNTVSRGNSFVPFPFELELPEEDAQREPRARLRICNVDRQIVTTIRSLSTPPTVLMEVVLASAPDSVEVSFPDFELRDASYDVLLVEGDLTQESFLDEPYPGDAFTPATFPGIF